MDEFGDLIVVIPGILGSRLERSDGKLLYDLTLPSLPTILRTITGEGLAHLNQDRAPDDDVVATDLFSAQWLPGFFGIDDYGALVAMLRQSVKYPHKQVITFPYDWRASNRWAAKKLKDMAFPTLKDWRSFSGKADAKLWLVCHSMGGLVARCFCEHFGGAEVTRELITIGTPHRGSAKALEYLVNGMNLLGFIGVSRFVRSLPSVYELLPQYPVLRESNGQGGAAFKLTDVYGLSDRLMVPQRSLAATPVGPVPGSFEKSLNLDRSMLERAVEFHADIRDPVVKRMNEGSPTPYKLRCFINRRQPTILSALLHSNGLEASKADPLAAPNSSLDLKNRGDGTVAAFSAIPIDFDDTSEAVVVPAKHVSMPSSAEVLEILYNWMHPLDVRPYMGGEINDALGLEVPSVIQKGEPLAIEVDALTAANVIVTLESVNGKSPSYSVNTQIQHNGKSQTIELGTPAQGTWRVTVSRENRRRPAVSDYVVVLAPE